MLTGECITSIVQSSTVTSLIAIGFVSAGVLTLAESLRRSYSLIRRFVRVGRACIAPLWEMPPRGIRFGHGLHFPAIEVSE